MFDWFAFQAGATAFLIAFAAAGVFTLAFKLIYQWVTPYHERTLIRDGNTAAAIALGGALIGYVLPLASALSHTVSLMEFAAWAPAGRRDPDRRLRHRQPHGLHATWPPASRRARSPRPSIWPPSPSASACSTPPA